MFKRILIYFISWKILAVLFLILAVFVIPVNLKFTIISNFGRNISYLFWPWANFDGYHYLTIAESGYGHGQYPFFPLFSAFINLVNHLTKLPYLFSALIISNLSFLLSLIILIKILILDKKQNLLNLFLLTIILFPTSFFYGAVYNDSLFLLFSSLTIYFSRKKSYLLASLCGGLATLARLNGLALMFIIFFEYIFEKEDNLNKQWDIRNIFNKLKTGLLPINILKRKAFVIIIIPISFVSYLAYTNIKFGNWNLVFTSMSVWNQDKITFPLQVFWRYFKMLILYPNFQFTYYIALLELLFVLFYIFLIIYSYKKIRLSYWLFFSISILIPSLTGTFQGMPRYGLHLYPMFLAIALLLENKNLNLKIIYFAITILLMFIFLGFFTRGYFVA